MGAEKGPLKGAAGIVVAAAVVLGVLLWLPAARWFLALAIVVGVLIAGGLYLWHKYKPVKTDDYNDKRPLGLS